MLWWIVARCLNKDLASVSCKALLPTPQDFLKMVCCVPPCFWVLWPTLFSSWHHDEAIHARHDEIQLLCFHGMVKFQPRLGLPVSEVVACFISDGSQATETATVTASVTCGTARSERTAAPLRWRISSPMPLVADFLVDFDGFFMIFHGFLPLVVSFNIVSMVFCGCAKLWFWCGQVSYIFAVEARYPQRWVAGGALRFSSDQLKLGHFNEFGSKERILGCAVSFGCRTEHAVFLCFRLELLSLLAMCRNGHSLMWNDYK